MNFTIKVKFKTEIIGNKNTSDNCEKFTSEIMGTLPQISMQIDSNILEKLQNILAFSCNFTSFLQGKITIFL